ncbi:MAG: competence/damage-inducible protein A [Salibacteraceae bacterium]
MKAQIITIGDEILIGQIVDTNSAWLANELNLIGISVHSIWSISDSREAIHAALDSIPKGVELVLMTGGLGPTNDDITKKALADWFKCGMRTDPRALQLVEEHFRQKGKTMPEVSRSQADVPACCDTLYNHLGTAPGMLFDHRGVVIVSMPGVPFEMKHIFSDQVVPRIRARFRFQNIYHRTILTQGIGESALMEKIKPWEESLAGCGIKLAYLPSPGMVRLRLSLEHENKDESRRLVEQKIQELLPLIADYAFGFDRDTLEVVVGRLLKKYGFTLSVAESCTGGYISHLITSVPGSSNYYMGSAVVYSYEAKVKVLNVNRADLESVGAVSEEVAMQMARGVRELYNTDFAVSSTGIAGPGGGTPQKPVGTVWIGVSSRQRKFALRFQMGNRRDQNIRQTALQALQLLRKEIGLTVKISDMQSLLFVD